MDVEYRIISDSEADIFAEISITELTLALMEETCELISVNIKDESLESYYIEGR